MLVPVVGALLVGWMARYGSPAIRGHGIPEAMEQVLFNESRIPARVLLMKPLSAVVSIGTGGPFGAEGPIIATGGALGSLVGQFAKITAEEFPVLDGTTVLGVVTQRELLAPSLSLDVTVAGLVSRAAVVIEPTASAREAADLMVREAVGRLPVVEQGRLMGIVTRSDLLEAHSRRLASELYPRRVRGLGLGVEGNT